MKVCKWCGVEKPLTDFSKHKMMADGHLNRCKSCCGVYRRAHRKTEKGRAVRRKEKRNPEWSRRYKKSAKGIAAAKRYKMPKHRVDAANAVKYAVKTGKLVRQPCEVCGAEKVEAHHWSYEREHRLDVKWLCQTHHREEHRRLDGKKSWV
jgi:hypothetical protein